MNTDKQYAGYIDINRLRTGEGDTMEFRVTDDESGCLVIDIQMSVEEFAYAITGMGNRDCAFRLLGIEQVGKRGENKAVKVLVLDGKRDTQDERIRTAVAEYEVDGWMGRDEDAKNWHNSVGHDATGNTYEVHYNRYVDAEPEQAAPDSGEEGKQ